jgi:hypothetical protein
MLRTTSIGMAAWCLLALMATAHAAPVPAETPRTIVFISDLHMGLGKDARGVWQPTEDFRWPAALEGFLDHISRTGNEAVDLVIVGDFLELWQPPAGVTCKGPSEDYGCSLPEMTTIVRAVVAAHRRELAALNTFSRRGSNCLHVIPGNHDAALVLDDIWAIVAESLGVGGGCVERAKSGIWTSKDGRVVAEHGHQIGSDPNRYGAWPTVAKEFGGITYLRRPWGEQFVQNVFNEEEAKYPLIDNLSPLSAGTKYRLGEAGSRAAARDVSRLVAFNLLETSVSQKISILGERGEGSGPPEWDVGGSRSLGRALFTGALAAEDPLAKVLADSGAFGRELDELARNKQEMPDDDVRALCDQLAARRADPSCPTVARATLGSLVEKTVSSRERTVGPYIKNRWEDHNNMRVFVYGHTHAFETEWPITISSRVSVGVLNDGAFQRVVDDAKFRELAGKAGKTPAQALRELDLSELPACYSFVKVSESSGRLLRELSAWHMPESGAGTAVDVCDPKCANVGHGCP